MASTRYNELFIQVLAQMAQQTAAKGEHFKTKAYKKAQETIMNFSGNITKLEDIEDLPGIGKSILERLGQSMLTQPTMSQCEVVEDPHNILAGVYGIRYYEDVLKRIPRSEINEYNEILGKTMLETLHVYGFEEKDAALEIVGSYRRGSTDSGDIDVIITTKCPQIFILWIDKLIKSKVILEVLSRGPSKCLVMAQIPGAKCVRRVDFLYSPPDEYAFSILYFTGSKEFNTAMRMRALEYGLTLNEHGFHHMIAGTKGKKVKGPKLTKDFKDEKSIFEQLEMVWKEPHERKDGYCVVGLENF